MKPYSFGFLKRLGRFGAPSFLTAAAHDRDVPFLFQTSDPTLIDAAYSAAPVLRKAFRPEQLIAALAALLAKER
jgi:hypothetical protein